MNQEQEVLRYRASARIGVSFAVLRQRYPKDFGNPRACVEARQERLARGIARRNSVQLNGNRGVFS